MKINFCRHKQQKAGFSLIEIIVSVTLFVVIIMSTTEIFRLVISGQRKAVASQNVQESLKYFLEATSKEIRMAKKNENFCSSNPLFNVLGADQVYAVSEAPGGQGEALFFRNFYNECVIYYLDDGRFVIVRNSASAPISPVKVNISELKFRLENYDFSTPKTRPVVVMKVSAQAYSGSFSGGNYRELADIEMQTSLTSRFYR